MGKDGKKDKFPLLWREARENQRNANARDFNTFSRYLATLREKNPRGFESYVSLIGASGLLSERIKKTLGTEVVAASWEANLTHSESRLASTASKVRKKLVASLEKNHPNLMRLVAWSLAWMGAGKSRKIFFKSAAPVAAVLAAICWLWAQREASASKPRDEIKMPPPAPPPTILNNAVPTQPPPPAPMPQPARSVEGDAPEPAWLLNLKDHCKPRRRLERATNYDGVDKSACFSLARHFERQGDQDEANKYDDWACATGAITSCIRSGQDYLYGRHGLHENRHKARSYLGFACRLGHSEACTALRAAGETIPMYEGLPTRPVLRKRL